MEASKASSGVIPVDCQPTNVNVLLSQLEGEYEERLQKAELTMIVHPAAGESRGAGRWQAAQPGDG